MSDNLVLIYSTVLYCFICILAWLFLVFYPVGGKEKTVWEDKGYLPPNCSVFVHPRRTLFPCSQIPASQLGRDRWLRACDSGLHRRAQDPSHRCLLRSCCSSPYALLLAQIYPCTPAWANSLKGAKLSEMMMQSTAHNKLLSTLLQYKGALDNCRISSTKSM